MIDLFAGAGGLSLGLEAAGFESSLAVELSPMAGETYFRNFVSDDSAAWHRHLELPIQKQVSRGLAIQPAAAVLNDFVSIERLLSSTAGDLDLLAGGPPCQGFSLAGLRNPADQRNKLPFEFLEFVRRLNPKLVLIENVTGIGMTFASTPGQSPLDQLRTALEITGEGYVAQILELNAKDFGVAQNRPRIMIAGIRRDLANSQIPSFVTEKRSLVAERWSSDQLVLNPPLLAPAEFVQSGLVPVGAVLGDIDGGGYLFADRRDYEGLPEAARLRFSEQCISRVARDRPPASHPPNHVLRRHGDTTTLRFALHVALAPYGVPNDLFGIGVRHGHDMPRAFQEVAAVLDRHRVPARLEMPDGSPIVDAAGEVLGGRRALTHAILDLRTKKHSQRALHASKPSPTVMSLPDDFVHYLEPRTLTVREMARIQSFPDSFVFFSKETTGSHRRRHEVPQYTQVGNAVPPLMARAVGLHLIDVLEQCLGRNALERPREDPVPA
jgi:DNA (cytosine-5)-methyltransferase 1